MSSVLAHAQALMAEATVENRSAENDHADARLKELEKRREVQADVLDDVSETQDELHQDSVEIHAGNDNKFLGWCNMSKEDKLRKLGNKIAENQAVAGEANEKANLIHSDEQAVFEDVKKANERVSNAVGGIQETLRAIDKARAKGGLS